MDEPERTAANMTHDHDGAHGHDRDHGHGQAHTEAPDPLVDPVCGMSVKASSAHVLEHAGATYRFCSGHCKAKFEQEPTRYLAVGAHEASASASASGAGAEVSYACPMHPDVRQQGPGSCPKCGMALEPAGVPVPATRTEWTCPMHPEIVRDEAGPCPICGMGLEPRTLDISTADENPELRDMTRRFWFAAVLTVPLVIIAMGDLLPGRPISQLFSMRVRTR